MRTIVKNIDRFLLGGAIKRRLHTYRERSFRASLQKWFILDSSLHYYLPKTSFLTDLFDKFGSDKGSAQTGGHPYPWPPHSYSDIYELVLYPSRESVEVFIECGIGTNKPEKKSSMGEGGKPGASLRAWNSFFPNAEIIGCDIDESILFNEDRIRTFQCDQTSPESISRFKESAGLNDETVDIIIDDGLHEFDAGVVFFNNTIDLLKVNGSYFIEDVRQDDAIRYVEYFSQQKYQVYLWNVSRSFLPISYNTLILIRKISQ